METIPEPTLWQLIGPTVYVIALIGVLVVIVLVVLGIRSRMKGRDTAVYSWWLGVTSRFMIIFGLLSFAATLAFSLKRVGLDLMSDAELLVADLEMAFVRLTIPLAVALFAHAGLMFVGLPRSSDSD